MTFVLLLLFCRLVLVISSMYSIFLDNITYKYELAGMSDDMYTYQAYGTTDKFTIIIKYSSAFLLSTEI